MADNARCGVGEEVRANSSPRSVMKQFHSSFASSQTYCQSHCEK